MFDKLGYTEKELIFRALRCLIEFGDGTGFQNNDRCHPFYYAGAIGSTFGVSNGQKNPENNALFKMLSALSRDFKDIPDITDLNWWNDFSEWQDFCKFAVAAGEKAQSENLL